MANWNSNDIILTGIGSKSSIVDTLGQRPGMTFASRNPKTAKANNNFMYDILKIGWIFFILNSSALIKGKAQAWMI